MWSSSTLLGACTHRCNLIQSLEVVAVTHWMRPSLILPSQLFADRYAGPLPIAKLLKRYGVIKSVVAHARQMTKSHHGDECGIEN
jgi:hypothetical protein